MIKILVVKVVLAFFNDASHDVIETLRWQSYRMLKKTCFICASSVLNFETTLQKLRKTMQIAVFSGNISVTCKRNL